VVCVFAVIIGVYILMRPSPLEQRVYHYGIAHGKQDGKIGLRRADDADDQQTAISYLSAPLLKNGKPDPESVNLIKEVFDSPEGQEKACLQAFARGYREGFQSTAH
jgi:hypothetical protein